MPATPLAQVAVHLRPEDNIAVAAKTAPWWLDVELMASWAGTYQLNIAALEGFIATAALSFTVMVLLTARAVKRVWSMRARLRQLTALVRVASPAESAQTPAPNMQPPRLLGNTGEQGEFDAARVEEALVAGATLTPLPTPGTPIIDQTCSAEVPPSPVTAARYSMGVDDSERAA